MVSQDAMRPKTILIVEDNELNMRLWNDILEAQGYALLKTALGLEAVVMRLIPLTQVDRDFVV